MPPHQIPQRLLQHPHINPAPRQPHSQRHVIRRPRPLQPIEEPQPSLGGGQRNLPRAASAERPRNGLRYGAVHPFGEPRRSGGGEYVAQGQGDSQGAPHPSHQAQREEGMAAEGEEVGVGARRRDVEDVREEAAEGFLQGRAGHAARVGGGRRRGEGAEVELAVGG
ncbi:hypothetical protein Saa2_06395 [Streptomyces acidiscabies]|nr:hypothetical protein Saa2_06395 [Streptomyces acidiscabies]